MNRLKYIFFLIVFTILSIDIVTKILYAKTILPYIYEFKNNSNNVNNSNKINISKSLLLAEKHKIDTSILKIKTKKHNYDSSNYSYGNILIEKFDGNMTDDVVKIWNEDFISEIFCEEIKTDREIIFKGYKDWCYSYKSTTNTKHPVYKYIPNSKVPNTNLIFNDHGWTGDNVQLKKDSHVIRLAFLGGSTTQQFGGCDFAYTDYVGFYLNRWSKLNNLDIYFETINTGRVAQQSMDFREIVKQELLPFKPDIVIYYEGRNQFDLSNLVEYYQYGSMNHNLLYFIIGQSFTIQKVMNLFNVNILKFIENLKSKNKIILANETNPNVEDSNLPINLNQIVSDITTISDTLKTINSTLVLSSFTMICKDSLVFNSRNSNSIYSYWLHDYGKIKLNEIKRLNDYENLVFKKTAKKLGIPFIDVANDLVESPEIFYDGIHVNCENIQVHGFSVFCQLLPIITNKINNLNQPDNSLRSNTLPIKVNINKTSFIKKSPHYYKKTICN